VAAPEAPRPIVRIHYQRLSARGLTIYTEHLLADDGVRLSTEEHLPPEIVERISAAFWRQGLLPTSVRLTRICKFLFYHEWFDILAVYAADGVLAGYYVDIVTPLRREGGEYYLTDLFLDFWLPCDGPVKELDQDEFDEAVAAGILAPDLAAQARAAFERVRGEIAAGIFPSHYISAQRL
jgi:hypothetical protein